MKETEPVKQFRAKDLLYSGFYATKDGEDALAKTVGVTKNFLLCGIVFGLYRTRITKSVKMSDTMFFFGRAIPVTLMGTSFAAVTQLSGQLRGVDGPRNHFFGGLATGPFLAVLLPKNPSILFGIWMGCINGSMCALMKDLRNIQRDLADLPPFN